jgi:hypothetical protein
MKKPAAFRDDNRANLVAISKLFEDIDHFVFFGTLLGITRGRDLIEGDDDIDILAPIEHRKLIIHKINNIDGFKVNFDKDCNKSDYFLQIESSVNNRNSLIDFYFYENNPGDDFIVDRWNFLGKHKNSEFTLHIPKKFIFPIVHEEYFGQKIKLPSDKELLCEWLYGKSWRTPRKKHVSYVIRIIKNRPILIKPIPKALRRFTPKPLRPLIERLINK